ncbi:MAG: hypothetical protein IKJ01_09110 [Lachnospiraceae bacterium]|nr:hypothetical protein [Lachnospiraceae bacterium]
MENTYLEEWQKINQLAHHVNQLQNKIAELELEQDNLYEQLSHLRYETDEDGNDINRSLRSAIYERIDFIDEQINGAIKKLQELRNQAHQMASSYKKQALEFAIKVKKTSDTEKQFQNLTKMRFGTSTALAGANLVNQRTKHYKDNVTVLNELAIGAESAATGEVVSPNQITVSERGTFQKPNQISHGTAFELRNNHSKSVLDRNFRTNENSVKVKKDSIVAATLKKLGISELPYKNGVPDFDSVSHVKITINMPNVGIVASGDAILAKKMGMTGREVVQYRQENGLVWRADESGKNANLIPESIHKAYGGKIEDVKPTPMEALHAYMCAHNYGKEDYAIYAKDKEWQKLHKQAFPEYHQISDSEMKPEEKINWISQVVPNINKLSAKQIVHSMEFYSGNGYSTIHWDKEAKLEETKDILKVFDSHNVKPYKGTIYRGLSFDSKEELINILKNCRGVWKEPGITSFSADKDIAEMYFAKTRNWGLVLSCSNNKSAIPFRHISILPKEDEILSPGGHRNNGWKIDYKSISVDKTNHMVYVNIEEI